MQTAAKENFAWTTKVNLQRFDILRPILFFSQSINLSLGVIFSLQACMRDSVYDQAAKILDHLQNLQTFLSSSNRLTALLSHWNVGLLRGCSCQHSDIME